MKTPKQLGYWMPAEWEPHYGTWLSWPKDPETFGKDIIKSVENAYVEVIRELQEGEKVFMLVNDGQWEQYVTGKLKEKQVSLKNIIFHHIKSVDVWTRDYAPTFLKNKKGSIACVKWNFNAWGNKYEDLKNDDFTGQVIARVSGVPIYKPEIVMEGGSIDVNGAGVLLTTEQCLLNKNRNPHLSKQEIENYLKDYLGIKTIIWLKEGIAGDDTDGHVDDFARFVNNNTVVCALEEDKKSENYRNLLENFEILKNVGLNVVALPMPQDIKTQERLLPASYANFYIGNNAVLVPIFNDKKDKEALSILAKLFPDRKVKGINCADFVYGFGGIHCATQQQPIMVNEL